MQKSGLSPELEAAVLSDEFRRFVDDTFAEAERERNRLRNAGRITNLDCFDPPLVPPVPSLTRPAP